MDTFIFLIPLLVVGTFAYISAGFLLCPQGMYDTYKMKTTREYPIWINLWYGLGVIIIWPYFWWKWKQEITGDNYDKRKL